MKLGTLKTVIKSGSHRACFDVTMLTNTAILIPFDKSRAQPKIRQKGEVFSMMHVVSRRI